MIETAMPARPDAIERLLDTMTLAEQVSLLSGRDFWTTAPIARLGIPSIKVTDGPNGARGGGSLVGGLSAAAFPVGIAVGAMWNPALAREIGAAIGREARSKGAQVLLAPTVNMQRTAINGRNFECYSEDPHLAAETAVAYVEGVQSTGVAAAIKHFVGNEIETDRTRVSSDVDERTLRELYLPPFEAAVRRARVGLVMTGYNALNGIAVSEDRRLLEDVLRGEWGFDGVVISDWGGTYGMAGALAAGVDLEMPGPTRHRGAALVAAVEAGGVDRGFVRAAAERVLRLIDRLTGMAEPDHSERSIDRSEDRQLIRIAAAEASVLLANDGVLPLDPSAKLRIAVIGPNAAVAQIMGGGSAQLNPHRSVAPLRGIVARAGPAIVVETEQGCENWRLHPILCQPVVVELFANPHGAGAPVNRSVKEISEVMWLGELADLPEDFSARLTATITVERTGHYSLGLASTGLAGLAVDGKVVIDMPAHASRGSTYFGNGSDERVALVRLEAGRDHHVEVDYVNRAGDGSLAELRAVRFGFARRLDDADMDRAIALAATADVAIVFAGNTGDWDTEGFDRADIALPGRQDALISRVAAANLRTVVVLQTGGPVAMPWAAEVAAILQSWYPGQECGHAIADMLFGTVSPSGRLPQTFHAGNAAYPAVDDREAPTGRIVYEERLSMGYRGGATPRFPFGHGLTYTTFRYGALRIDRARFAPGEHVTATIDITNTGAIAAQEVVQLYVRDDRASVDRPDYELKGFAKLALGPGETGTASFRLDLRAFAFFDVTRKAWIAEAGDYTLIAAASATDHRATTRTTLDAMWCEAV